MPNASATPDVDEVGLAIQRAELVGVPGANGGPAAASTNAVSEQTQLSDVERIHAVRTPSPASHDGVSTGSQPNSSACVLL